MRAVVPLIEPVLSRSRDALQQARRKFSELEAWLSSPEAFPVPLHEVEHGQERKGREVQRWMLQAHIEERGPGEVGPALRVVEGDRERLYRQRRLRQRGLKTIFGPIEMVRMSYGRRGEKSIHPLDEALQFPARSFSYELQKRMVKAAV